MLVQPGLAMETQDYYMCCHPNGPRTLCHYKPAGDGDILLFAECD